MKLNEKINLKINENEFTRRLTDYDFRTILFTVISLVITVGYATFYAMLGVVLRSFWYGMLAWYYLMIVIMRSFVVFYHKGKRKRAQNTTLQDEKLSRAKIYRNCGIVICLLTFPLSFAILQMVAESATFSHEGLMIYTAATYTTYKVVRAIRNFLKAKKSEDLTVRTARDINLADMLVSVLALQTAMFHSFSPDENWSVMNALTGAAVCLATVIIGAFMIINGKRAVTQINYEANLQKISETSTKS